MGVPSNPGWKYGYTPPPAEWNNVFSGKADFPVPLDQGGTGGQTAATGNYNLQQRVQVETATKVLTPLTLYSLRTDLSAMALSLPPANTCLKGDWIELVDTGANAAVNKITVNASGADQILSDAASVASIMLQANNSQVTLITDGVAKWRLINGGASALSVLDSLGTSHTQAPSQNAVKTAVDSLTAFVAGGSFSSVSALNVAVGFDLIQTSGATRGMLIADTTLTDADVTAYPQAIVKTANGRFFRRDQQDLRGAQFGMDPAATDNSAALSALIAYQIFRSVNAAQGLRGGASATFGAGIYSFTQDISIKGGTFAWSGSSGSTGYGLGSATVFQMVGAVGFTLHRSDTPDAIIPFGGDGFISNNICYRGSATGTKPVFTAHSRFHFRHSSCINGGSHGLAVIADVGATALSGLRGEASISTIFSGAFSGNGGSGILFSGGDANACKAYGYDAVGNQRYGIEDLSFLGNTFDGHHRDNVLGPYFANNPNAGTLALGTYTESGQPPAQLGGRGLVIGGTQAAGWTYNTAIFFAENGAPASNGLMTRRLSADGLTTLTVSFALDAAGGAIWSAGRTGYTGSAIERFRGADVVRSLDYSDGSVSYLWTGAGTTMAFGRAAIVPNVHVFYNFSLGTRIWAEGTVAPTTGSHAQGERVWNTAPVAGGTEGWVCVTSGTPGTWKTFGTIAA
jgi:hypothetical protein